MIVEFFCFLKKHFEHKHWHFLFISFFPSNWGELCHLDNSLLNFGGPILRNFGTIQKAVWGLPKTDLGFVKGRS